MLSRAPQRVVILKARSAYRVDFGATIVSGSADLASTTAND